MTKQEKIDEILQEADEACESENYHDRYGLAFKLFDGLKGWVPKKHRVRLAEILRDQISP